MPRVTPPDRYSTLLDAAAAAFVEHGFQRTQMDDIAERLGVSKGTSYRAVESKDVLFVAVVAWADRPEHIPTGGLDDAGDALCRLAGLSRFRRAALCLWITPLPPGPLEKP